ncbi:MAG: FkbM family methyltransferase [Oligoflexales bacterium]|nr:FkbM family methyltransferase [Oligoflexales bacterium]
MLPYIFSRLSRVSDFIFDMDYRKTIFSRLVLFLLHKINSDIKYVGLDVKGEKTFFFTGDNAITPYALATGGFQKEDVLKTISLLQNIGLLKRGGIFLDIGANIGTQTIYALNSGFFKKAYCFEPVASNIDLLQINLFANRFLDKAVVVSSALSDFDGESEITLSTSNCGDHRIVRTGQLDDRLTQKILCKTLDRYLSEQDLPADAISLVWMDTQGHEAQILAGASNLLKSGTPFVIEFWPWALDQAGEYDRIIKIIKNNFSAFYDLQAKNLVKRKIEDLEEFVKKLDQNKDSFTDFLLTK